MSWISMFAVPESLWVAAFMPRPLAVGESDRAEWEKDDSRKLGSFQLSKVRIYNTFICH